MFQIIIFINIILNLETMSGLVKLAIYGGAAYLAYNYYVRRKANNKAASVSLAIAEEQEKESLMLDAEMQEEGQEGMAVDYGGGMALEYGNSVQKDAFHLNDWDSDNLTSGI